jgi:hypothetical protein
MKKVLVAVLAACIALYFISSCAFPAWGERIVVTVMLLCLIAGAVCAVWLAVLLIRAILRKRR